MAFSIAIDGPAAAGKTTTAKLLAKKLNFTYIDTGAMYRALAVKVQNEGVEDVPGMLESTKLEVRRREDGEQCIFVDGVDVTDRLRTPDISMLASNISKLPEVRGYLLELQRDLAKNGNVIMEGRDIGTVVLPDADVKIYLTAKLKKRAFRSLYAFVANHEFIKTLAWYEEELKKRDAQDINREVAPLKQAEDAILIDNSYMTIEETIARVLGIVEGRIFEQKTKE